MNTVNIADPNWVPPREVAEFWRAHHHHFFVQGSVEPFDRQRCKCALERVHARGHSDAWITRLLQKYGPHGTEIACLVWLPALRQHEPPWLTARRDQQAAELQDQVRQIRAAEGDIVIDGVIDGLLKRAEVAIEKADPQTEEQVYRVVDALRMLKKSGGSLAAAAAMFVGVRALLDIESDGVMNGVIDWCHLLLPHIIH
jgi:hypothetical protein